jgi:hypothetical protein
LALSVFLVAIERSADKNRLRVRHRPQGRIGNRASIVANELSTFLISSLLRMPWLPPGSTAVMACAPSATKHPSSPTCPLGEQRSTRILVHTEKWNGKTLVMDLIDASRLLRNTGCIVWVLCCSTISKNAFSPCNPLLKKTRSNK